MWGSKSSINNGALAFGFVQIKVWVVLTRCRALLTCERGPLQVSCAVLRHSHYSLASSASMCFTQD